MSPGLSRVNKIYTALWWCTQLSVKTFPISHFFFCRTWACGIPPYQEPPFSKQQPCHALGSALPMAGTGPTPGADSHSLFQDHLPQRQLHPSSKQECGRVNTAPFSCGQVIFLHFPSDFIPHPLPSLSFWHVSPLINTATKSWAKHRFTSSEAAKKRRRTKVQN